MSLRDTYFDNIKFVTIVLVCLFHFGVLGNDDVIMNGFYSVLGVIIMPTFIFVSGYFSKKINGHRAREINEVLLIYFVFEIINLIYTQVTGLGRGDFNIFMPTFQNWYLISLFIWRLLTPYFSLFPKKRVLILSFLLSIYVALFYNNDTFLILNRAVFYMPFFIVGYYIEDLNVLHQKYSKYKFILIGGGIITAILVFLFATNNSVTSESTTELTEKSLSLSEVLSKIGATAILHYMSFIVGFALLYLIPTKETIFTKYGKNTMGVFLFHMFLLYPSYELLKDYNITGYALVGISFSISIIVTLIFSQNIFTSFINFIIHPKGKKENI